MGTDRTVSPRAAMIIIVAIVGAALLIGLLAGDDTGNVTGTDLIPGDDSDDVAPASEGITPSADPISSADADAGPDVPPIKCQGLITQDETDDALGTWDRDPIPGSIDFQRGETCIEEYAEASEFFVSIGPGELSDFLPDAQFGGVTGEPVTGVGDGAVWFDGESGTLSVLQETTLGGLVYRVGIGRPDVDSATRLEIAKTLAADALPRFPGVQIEPVEPTEVTFEIGPVEFAGLSYVDNLRAKEDAGEWTHGEGLVASLELLLGRRDPSDVLRVPDLGDPSGSGVIRLAQNELETGSDEEIRTSLAALLDELLLSRDELDEIIATAVQPEDDVEGGDENISLSPSTVGRSVTLIRTASPAPSSRLVQGARCGQSPGGCATSVEIGSKYLLLGPAPGVGGWTEEKINAAIVAISHAAEIYEQLGDMPDITVMLTGLDGEAYIDMSLGDLHTIYLNTDLQVLGVEEFQQSIAGQMALSLLANEFGAYAGEGIPEYAQRWWTDGLAVYLSGVAYPHGNREQEHLPDLLAAMEAGTSLMERGPATWLFFEYLHSQIGGEQGVIDLIRSLPPLEDYPDIAAHWHTFNELLADGAVFDLDGEGVTFGAKHEEWIVIGPHLANHDLAPFGVFRLFMASPGQDGCVKFEGSGVSVSMRFAGGSGPLDTDTGAPGTWGGVPTGLIGDINYEMVVTTGSTGGTFNIETIDKKDAEECSPAVFNDAGPTETVDTCSLEDICGPSDFYSILDELWEAVKEGLRSE